MKITFLWAALMLGVAADPARAATFSEGRQAYDQNHIADAERIFAEVVADKAASVVDRSSAELELARIAWLIDGNDKKALTHLAAAQRIGDKPCATLAMTARVLRESKRSEEAVRRSGHLLAACPESAGRDEIRTHLIGARLDLASRSTSKRESLLAQAAAEGEEFSPDADIEAARVRLETALVTGDATRALAAWKDYFWLDNSDAPQALASAGATAIFTSGLRNDASVDERLRLAVLLMRAGFGVQSQRFAKAHRLETQASGNPIVRRLQAYWPSREKFEQRLLGEYRRFARGGKVDAVLKAEAEDIKQADAEWSSTLLGAAGEAGDRKTVLRRVYGLVGTDVGSTDGYPSVHLGHVIEDHDDRVSQYGKTASIRFMAIDNLISNSFSSWLFDGRAMVGGWQANGIIVHIRPGYVQSPLRAYRQTRDGEDRRRLISRGNRLAPEDLIRLKARSVATLEGLSSRLQLQLIDRVAAVARTQSTDQASFRRAFLAEYSRANLDQSITKHEGRHAIDEALGISAKVEQPVLEYQAKLSELALTDYPRMALQNMDRNLEGDGPHDLAGRKIFDEFRKWMEANTGQIMGYASDTPVLAQLDKLSDDQLRDIARGLDPLASGKSSPAKL